MCRPRYKKCVPAAGRAQCGGSCVRSWLLLEQRRLRCAAISALVRPFSLGGKWRSPGAFCGGLRCCAAFGGFDYFFFPPELGGQFRPCLRALSHGRFPSPPRSSGVAREEGGGGVTQSASPGEGSGRATTRSGGGGGTVTPPPSPGGGRWPHARLNGGGGGRPAGICRFWGLRGLKAGGAPHRGARRVAPPRGSGEAGPASRVRVLVGK